MTKGEALLIASEPVEGFEDDNDIELAILFVNNNEDKIKSLSTPTELLDLQIEWLESLL